MKRLMVISVVVELFCLFGGIDTALARYNRDDYGIGGFSLWQIFIGGFLLVVMFAIIFGGGESKEKIEKQNKENKERKEREKSKKGIIRYYGEGILAMLLYWSAPFILIGIIWLFS